MLWFLLVSCLIQHHTAMEKYKWLPTECAPKKYPMTILKGDLIFKNGGSIYIPEGKVLYNGWGEIGSTHVVGEEWKPVPYQLNITWFSYTEDKFYQGIFNLPHDIITSLFQKGFISPSTGKLRTYDRVMVGLAPEGEISIWLSGERVVKEVCFFQAKETKIDWAGFVDNPAITRKEYLKMILKEVLNNDEIASLKENGLPVRLWMKYRTRYPWEPTIIGKAVPTDLLMVTYNGEHEFIDYTSEKKRRLEKRAIVKNFELRWTSEPKEKYFATVDFDEQEIFTSFEKLYNEQLPQELQLQVEINSIDHSLKIYLRNDLYILELKKCIIKVYSE